MTTPVGELRAAVERAAASLRDGQGHAPAGPRRRSSVRRRRSSATTRRTRRCCWRRCSANRRATSPARLGDALGRSLGPLLDRVEVAGPGFLNLFLADAWYREALGRRAGGGRRVRRRARRPRSASTSSSSRPTRPGPLTAAAGRHAAYGDALARLLDFAGHEVEREYYFNDAGSQVEQLGESIRARARGRGGARGRLPGRVRGRAGGRAPRRGRRRSDELGARRRRR